MKTLQNKKIISIAMISLFILSMFFASVALAPVGPTLTLNPTSGPSGTIVTITGSGFASGTYRVYFDRDGDSRYDYGETYRTVSVGAPGTFTTTLTIPSVSSGLYYIRADVSPYTPPAIASAPFIVKTVWDKLLDIEDIIDGIEAKLDGMGFQEDGGATAEFSNDQQLVGRYSVYLSTGATPASGFGAVREYVQMAFSDISDLSFWYRIDSSTSTVISSIDMSIQHPYWREGATPTATGYFSPYFVIQIYDGTTRHWIVSQQWAEPPANADKWIQWKMTDSGQEYPPGSGMNPTQALWHDELWSDDLTTGGSGGYPAGWEYLSYFKTKYAGYTVEQIKIGIGEFTPITEKQSAYVDSKSVNGVEHNIEPGLGNIMDIISVSVSVEVEAIEDKLDDTTRWVSDADLDSAVSSIESSIDSATSSLESSIDSAVSSLEYSIDLAVSSIESSIDSAVSSIESSIDLAVGAIESKLDNWFDTGGTYSETTQIETMGDRFTSTTGGSFYYQTSGTGTAGWSTEQAHTGDGSVKLTTVTTSDWARIVFPGQGETLSEITELSYWSYVTATADPSERYRPWVGIYLDSDGNLATWEYYIQAEPKYRAVGIETEVPLNTWEQWDAYDSTYPLRWMSCWMVGGWGESPDRPYEAPPLEAYIDGSAMSWPTAIGNLQFAPREYGSLTVIAIKFQVGYGTAWDNFVGYVDDIVISDIYYNVEKAEASDTAQFTVTLSVDVTDTGDKAIVKATFDGINWVILEELTTDGYKSITIAARGVEILYYDSPSANVIIDWGITVIAKPGVTIT